MTDFEREERAFREAFAEHAAGAPESSRPVRRRARWLAPVLVAAVVLAVVGGTTVILRDSGSTPVRPAESSSYWETHAWRWIGIRDVEVKAPAGWDPEFEVGRPDCIRLGTDDVVKAGSVPPELKDPYVVLGDPSRLVRLIGCSRDRKAGDPDPIFGQIPFPLWQPYVKIVEAKDVDRPEYQDAQMSFRDWRLTRVTTRGLQITVLSAPGDEDLGSAVVGSLRTVTTTELGCPVESELLGIGTTQVDIDARPLPRPADVQSIVVCEYVSSGDSTVHNTSRRIVAAAAADLTRAIVEAPLKTESKLAGDCRAGSELGRRLSLAFRTGAGGSVPVTSAYMFVGGCRGTGVLEPGGFHELTRANCSPLFAVAPIGLFSAGSASTYSRCHTR